MQNRLNLWQRLEPKYKEAIKEQYKKYTYRRADIEEELKSKEYFTEVSYGIAFDIMRPNKLDFLGDAFNPGYVDE